MSTSLASSTSSLQSYNLALFRTAIHPEFFEIQDRKRIKHGEYEFEAWLMNGTHALRFEYQGLCITEIVGDQNSRLPDRGHVTTLQCAGEKDHDAEFSDRIVYIASMTTETLTDHLYLGSFNEMREHALENDCMVTCWDEGEGESMSILDVQRHFDEVHVQAFHFRKDCGLVLRTQTIFQIKDNRSSD